MPFTQHLHCFNRSLYFSLFRGRIKQDAVTHKHGKNIFQNTSDKSWRFQSSSLSSSSSCNTSSSRRTRDKHCCHHTPAKFSKQAALESRCFHPKTWLPTLQLTLHPCPAGSHFSRCAVLKCLETFQTATFLMWSCSRTDFGPEITQLSLWAF